MSDVKAIFDTILREAAAEAEQEFLDMVGNLPRLPVSAGDPLGTGPAYTPEQRQTLIDNYVANAVGRLTRHLTNIALGRAP